MITSQFPPVGVAAARLGAASVDPEVQRLLFDIADPSSWEDAHSDPTAAAAFTADDVDRHVRAKEWAKAGAAVASVADPNVLRDVARAHRHPRVVAAVIRNASTPVIVLANIAAGANYVLARAAQLELRALAGDVAVSLTPAVLARLTAVAHDVDPPSIDSTDDEALARLTAHALLRRSTLAAPEQLQLARMSDRDVSKRLLCRSDVVAPAAELASTSARWLALGHPLIQCTTLPAHVLHALAGVVPVDTLPASPGPVEMLVSYPNTNAATVRRLAERGHVSNRLVAHPDYPDDFLERLRSGSPREAAVALASGRVSVDAHLREGEAKGFRRRALAANRHISPAAAEALAAMSDEGILCELSVNPSVEVGIRASLVARCVRARYVALDSFVDPRVWRSTNAAHLVAGASAGWRAAAAYLATRLGSDAGAWGVAVELLGQDLTLQTVADLAVGACAP